MQSKQPSIWVNLLISAACLSACARTTSVPPSPSASTPTGQSNAPAQPTSTPRQRTATLTQSIPPNTTADPTPDLIATIQAGSPAEIHSSQVSPDGLWWARVFSYPCPEETSDGTYGYDTLQFTDQRKGDQRIVASQLIACGGLGAFGLGGRFWSPTSRFYYFTDAAFGVPDGCGYWQPPLLRVDLTDWSITRLGAGAISPDGFTLAAWLDGELVLWDLNGDRLGSAPPPVSPVQPGPITWSPDGQSIAYLLSEQSCPLGLTYLVRMSLADLQPALYLASQDPSFADLRWDAPNRVTLTDEAGRNWVYNFITGGLAHGNNP